MSLQNKKRLKLANFASIRQVYAPFDSIRFGKVLERKLTCIFLRILFVLLVLADFFLYFSKSFELLNSTENQMMLKEVDDLNSEDLSSIEYLT